MIRASIALIREAHEHTPDVTKFAASICATIIAAVTTQQENIAWVLQCFMWAAAGILSTVSAVSIAIRTIRQWRHPEEKPGDGE